MTETKAPERIWIDDKGVDSSFWNDNGDAIGTTEYVRADLATPLFDGGFNAGIEAAAKVVCSYCANPESWREAVPDPYPHAGPGRLEHLPVSGTGTGRGCGAYKIRALKSPSGEAHAAETPEDWTIECADWIVRGQLSSCSKVSLVECLQLMTMQQK